MPVLMILHSRPTSVHGRDICCDPHAQYERLKQQVGRDRQKKSLYFRQFNALGAHTARVYLREDGVSGLQSL